MWKTRRREDALGAGRLFLLNFSPKTLHSFFLFGSGFVVTLRRNLWIAGLVFSEFSRELDRDGDTLPR